MRLMAENAGSDAFSYRLRRHAHQFERAAEEASHTQPATSKRKGGARPQAPEAPRSRRSR
jgi:hypothetical protein